MSTYRDLSGNGAGVVVESKINAIDLSTTDATVSGKTQYLRANGAGNVIIRSPGSSVDVTIPAKDGEYIPVEPGTIVRRTGTTTTSLLGMAGMQ
jgi:uncharacterized protein (AIM24 family)